MRQAIGRTKPNSPPDLDLAKAMGSARAAPRAKLELDMVLALDMEVAMVDSVLGMELDQMVEWVRELDMVLALDLVRELG